MCVYMYIFICINIYVYTCIHIAIAVEMKYAEKRVNDKVRDHGNDTIATCVCVCVYVCVCVCDDTHVFHRRANIDNETK